MDVLQQVRFITHSPVNMDLQMMLEERLEILETSMPIAMVMLLIKDMMMTFHFGDKPMLWEEPLLSRNVKIILDVDHFHAQRSMDAPETALVLASLVPFTSDLKSD